MLAEVEAVVGVVVRGGRPVPGLRSQGPADRRRKVALRALRMDTTWWLRRRDWLRRQMGFAPA